MTCYSSLFLVVLSAFSIEKVTWLVKNPAEISKIVFFSPSVAVFTKNLSSNLVLNFLVNTAAGVFTCFCWNQSMQKHPIYTVYQFVFPYI